MAPERVEEGVVVEAAAGLGEGESRRVGGTGEVVVGVRPECHCGVVPAVGLSVEGWCQRVPERVLVGDLGEKHMVLICVH